MNWSQIIRKEMEEDYFKILLSSLQTDGAKHRIFPERKDIFKAFSLCPFEKTKVCILGMDPYINPGQAHGLSFSVPDGVEPPPSLKNIFKELNSDIGMPIPTHGNLTKWAQQGILLLNAALTVREGQSGSHSAFGWHIFTNQIISILNDKPEPMVFILWGSDARKKKKMIDKKFHCILEGGHPSPLSANRGLFFGGKYFSKTNEFLIENNISPIDWNVL